MNRLLELQPGMQIIELHEYITTIMDNKFYKAKVIGSFVEESQMKN